MSAFIYSRSLNSNSLDCNLGIMKTLDDNFSVNNTTTI